MALFGARGPIGFAVGPFLGGLVLVDGLGWSPVGGVLALGAAVASATGALVGSGRARSGPSVVPEGRVLSLAFGAVRGVLVGSGDPSGSSRSTAWRSSRTR